MLMEFLNITVYTSVHKKQTNDQAKQGQITIYKTLHAKTKIEQLKPH
jgi:hypothetical protein